MQFLSEVVQLYIERGPWFASLLLSHLRLSVICILLAGAIGLFLGTLIAEHRRFAGVVIGVCNVIYTIPSISLLGLLIPLLGIGNRNAIVAITLYAIMPIVRNTYAGITGVSAELLEAAAGMGSTRRQILFRIKLPLATGVILAGLRSMVVMVVSLGGIASFVGADGLGKAVFRGISIYNPAMTFAGSLLIAALALLCDFILSRVEKKLKKKWRINE